MTEGHTTHQAPAVLSEPRRGGPPRGFAGALSIEGVLKEARRLVAKGIAPPIAIRRALPDPQTLRDEDQNEAIWDGIAQRFHFELSLRRGVDSGIESEAEFSPRPAIPQRRLDVRSFFANINYGVGGKQKNVLLWTKADRRTLVSTFMAREVGIRKRREFVQLADSLCEREGVRVPGDLSDSALNELHRAASKTWNRRVA